jgi:hypothetical protein
MPEGAPTGKLCWMDYLLIGVALIATIGFFWYLAS